MIGLDSRGSVRRLGTLLLAFLLLMALSSLVVAQSQGDTGTVTLTGARLNVRSAPASTAEVIGKLETGAVVSIIDASSDGLWLLVDADALDSAGWVSAAFVARDAAASPTPLAGGGLGLQGAAGLNVVVPAVKVALPTTSAVPTSAIAPTVIATTTHSAVVLPTATTVATRAAASANAASTTPAAATPAATSSTSVAGTTPATPTTAATVSATTTNATAQASSDAAPDSKDLGVGDPIAVTRPASMNLRGGPGTNYGVIGAAPAGTRLYITGVTDGADWYRVNRADSTEAWVSAALVDLSGAVDGIATLAADEIPEAPVDQSPVIAPLVANVNAPAPSGFGDFGYGITANMWQGEKGSVANAVQDLGFNWVKQQVRWEYVEESPGAVNWQEMDAIVNTMNGYGINVAFSIVTSPLWTRPNLGGTGGPPEDFQLFANFAGAVAGRYCGQSLKAIEVWNEQNLQREWEGLPLDPGRYMDLLKRAYASIKAACPSMLVISGATTPAGNSDVAVDDIDYLRGMYQNGLASYSDGIGIHPSGFANPPSVRFSDWQSGGYNAESHVNHRSFYFLSTLEESRNVMLQFGDANKRLWPTEFGWGSAAQPWPGYEYQQRVSEEEQANWTVESFRIMANSGYVGVAFLWNLNYNTGEMSTFSIVGRPVYAALKAMMGR